MAAHAEEPRPLDTEALRERLGRVHALHTSRRIADPLEPLDVDAFPGEDLSLDVGGYRERLWCSAIPQRFHPARLEHFTGAARDALEDWAAEPAGRNLLIVGPVGVGKTHAAVAACRPAHDRGLEARFLPIDEALYLLSPGGPEGALYELATQDRLIIDDVGAHYDSGTGWSTERFYALLNRRWLEVAPTVMTSNLSLDALPQVLGERTFSRMVGSDAVVIALSGPDRRRAR
jgi:chromosomal replication initiation ATPase DnaA